MNCLTADLFLDYIRMVSYAIVILASLRGIFVRKFSNSLFIGDILMAFGMISTLFFTNLFKTELSANADKMITPAAVIWAFIHLRAMFKESKRV
jgi:hypothetical protein